MLRPASAHLTAFVLAAGAEAANAILRQATEHTWPQRLQVAPVAGESAEPPLHQAQLVGKLDVAALTWAVVSLVAGDLQKATARHMLPYTPVHYQYSPSDVALAIIRRRLPQTKIHSQPEARQQCLERRRN